LAQPFNEIQPIRAIRRLCAIAVGVGLALLWLLGPAGGTIRGFTHTVAATDYVFSPQVVTIALGDTISWTFAGEPHTVTSGTVTAGIPHPDGRFDSGIRQPGETYMLGPGAAADPIASPGTYPYYCAVHAEQMTGTIVVQGGASPEATPRPSTAPTSPTGASAPALTPPTAADSGLTQSSPRADPTPTTRPSDETGTFIGPLIGLVGLGALAVVIGLLANRGRSGRRP